MNLIPWRSKRGRSELGTRELAPFDAFRDEMQRVFDRFFSRGWEDWQGPPGLARLWEEDVDVEETDDEVLVRADVPGFDPGEIDVSVSGDLLTISAERKEEREDERRGYRWSERRSGSIRRSVRLPSYVDSDSTSAEYRNGVLTV